MRLTTLFLGSWLGLVGGAAADFEALNYGGEGKVVDLAVGLWAWPLPMDYDEDGDLDLVVACPDKPSRGTYFFENPGGGGKLPVFKAGVRVGDATQNLRVSYVDGVPRVLVAGSEVVDAVGGKFEKRERVHPKPSAHPSRVRANQWTFVDWEGDGDQDIVVGAGDWADYGWDAAYDAQGRWRNGPLRGFVYLLERKEDGWAEAVKVRAGGSDVEVYGWPTPNFADFDGDGDLDLLCGEFLDGFTYFENAGMRGAPVYLGGKRLEVKMDLQMIVPTALDWDGDGDVDLVVGDEDGRVALVEHTGEVVGGVPVFADPVYFQQEADTLNAGALATPYAVDWDGDGDEDLLCGNTAGYVLFYENLTGGATPEWGVAERLEAGGEVIRIQAGENGSIQGPCEAKWGYTTLSAADWDGDGKVDLIVNSIWGSVLWYRRGDDGLEAARPVEVAWTAGARKPAWNWWDPNGEALATQWRTTPETVDWDGDGLVDLVMLDQEGYLAFWKKREDGKVEEPARIFVDEKGAALRLNAKSCGASGRVKLTVADWDGDGRKDVLVNSENAALLRNLGERDGTVVLKRSGNLGKQNLAGHTSSPAVCDFDGDGVLDLLVGSESGTIHLLRHGDAKDVGEAELIPAWEAVAPGAVVLEEFVYEKASFPECHASTVAATPRGLVCALFGGTKEQNKDVGIWVSYHDGVRWGGLKEVANGVQYAGHRHPCWNPVLHYAGDGHLLLFYKCGPSPDTWWGMLTESFDSGRTWGESRRLPEGIDGPVKNKPFVLADGSLLCPSSTEYDGWRVHFERTADLGKTWERTEAINDGKEFNAIQPSVLRHADGRLQILCRSKESSVLTSWSEDEGKTWSALERTELPNPNSGTDAITLRDGRHLIVYNPTKRVGNQWGGSRSILSVAISDDGVKWDRLFDLDKEEKGEFSYPAVIQADDGRVHITYTWRRQRVKHVVLEPALLGRE